MITAIRFLLASAACFASAAVAAAGIAGSRPAYTDRALSEPPNAAALRARMWAPDIDLGMVPQGITVVGDSVLLSAYNGAHGFPTCRLYRIDRRTLAVTGRFDLPPMCGHAGGLAYAGGRRLFVADTEHLFEIDLEKAFAAKSGGDAVVRTLSLPFPLRGSFLAYRDGALWIGVYTRPEPGRIVRFPLKLIDAHPQWLELREEQASASLATATRSQGAAFDRDGFLWLSQSSSQFGRLQKVDPKSGKVLASYAAVDGIEDLGFDADGRLWAVSEAGSKRWFNWPTYYPILFSIDVRALH